jgi:hypothetical protein
MRNRRNLNSVFNKFLYSIFTTSFSFLQVFLIISYFHPSCYFGYCPCCSVSSILQYSTVHISTLILVAPPLLKITQAFNH